MSVHIETTPNPNALKFTTDSMIFEGNNSVSVMPGQTSEHAILNELMELDGVDNVFGFQNFITVNKQMDADWEGLSANVKEVIEKHGY
ncbi:NifU N-terminal domain-containing protein [Radiobacillus kanasensis]|uniref:NifU N-terminal domain-containing protein n=1 Tax=Radiobacillus kanasensis TaxID=2844358 RepID=UPI001E370365|nr:NifU N-terminal domain-containing protein [Radiobacillus kanasensis]UFU00538.1 NifU N-terminal domain-containing protein [Radiobacillus kanasensis]